MAVTGALFSSGGKQSTHYIPGAYSRIDYVNSGSGTVSTANAVIMGDSRGGEPNKLLWFSSAAEAESVLRSGNLLTAIKHAFNPGGGYVPQRVAAWRVNPGTQATKVYKSGSNTLFTVYAWDWGLHGNQIKSKLENGTEAGSYKISIQFQNEPLVVKDNIKRESFSIQYIGAGTTATITITPTGLVTTVDAVEDLNVSFESYPTIDSLIAYLNTQTDYSVVQLTSDGNQLCSELDSVNDVDIKTSSLVLKSNLAAIVDAFESLPWVGKVVEATLTSRVVPGLETDFSFFSGGTDGAYTITEWVNSLALLEAEDIQLIGTSSIQETVHLAIKNHCEQMSSVTGKSERQFIVGGSVGESVDTVITRAKNLASDKGSLCYPGFIHYDFNNPSKTKVYDPAFYACKEIGRQVALTLNEPATNKEVDVLGWEKTLTTTDMEKLIQAGVWVGSRTKDGRNVNIRSVTTYQGSELQRCEFSMMRESLFVSRDVRVAVERAFVGRAGTADRLSEIDAVVLTKLAYYALSLQLFVGNPAYWGYSRRVNGDQVIIDFSANLVAPINFGFITSHFYIYASNNG